MLGGKYYDGSQFPSEHQNWEEKFGKYGMGAPSVYQEIIEENIEGDVLTLGVHGGIKPASISLLQLENLRDLADGDMRALEGDWNSENIKKGGLDLFLDGKLDEVDKKLAEDLHESIFDSRAFPHSKDDFVIDRKGMKKARRGETQLSTHPSDFTLPSMENSDGVDAEELYGIMIAYNGPLRGLEEKMGIRYGDAKAIEEEFEKKFDTVTAFGLFGDLDKTRGRLRDDMEAVENARDKYPENVAEVMQSIHESLYQDGRAVVTNEYSIGGHLLEGSPPNDREFPFNHEFFKKSFEEYFEEVEIIESDQSQLYTLVARDKKTGLDYESAKNAVLSYAEERDPEKCSEELARPPSRYPELG